MGRDGGQTTLKKGPNKPKKLSEKIPQKGEVAVSDLFSAELAVFALKSAS